MPSWNIHTAHVECLLANHCAEGLGIDDENAFLFGNYVPDIYVGFMVPGASLHIDYCITHFAKPDIIPVPDADKFWDYYIVRRRPSSSAGLSLVLGAWAHLVADRFYNGRFRAFSITHDVPEGEALRVGKQGDFALYGQTLGITNCTNVTPELLDAALSFYPFSILPDDARRAVDVANAIVQNNGASSNGDTEYALLSAEWMDDVFKACDERLSAWLAAWRVLEAEGKRCMAEDVRTELGLPTAELDDSDWLAHGKRPLT